MAQGPRSTKISKKAQKNIDELIDLHKEFEELFPGFVVRHVIGLGHLQCDHCARALIKEYKYALSNSKKMHMNDLDGGYRRLYDCLTLSRSGKLKYNVDGWPIDGVVTWHD